jgi:hypothetical protein
MLKFIIIGFLILLLTVVVLDKDVQQELKSFKFWSIARFFLVVSFFAFLLFVIVLIF